MDKSQLDKIQNAIIQKPLLKLGICIDGVIRNKFEQFDKMYRKHFIKNANLVGMNDNFEVVEESETDDEFQRLEILTNSKIHLPQSSYDLLQHYDFSSRDDYNKFLNETCVLNIFGLAPEFSNTMESTNKIQYIGENEKMFTTTLICHGENRIINATFHFLTKNACRIKNITFAEYNKNLWGNFDVIITDCPDVLDNKPAGKTSVKIQHEYNVNSKSDFEFENINELANLKSLYGAFNHSD